MRSLTPSRSLPLPPLSHHHSCLNFLRDPSMKRHMERISGYEQPSDEAPPAQNIPSFPASSRSCSAAVVDLHRVSCSPSSVPSFLSDSSRVSCADMSRVSPAAVPRVFCVAVRAEANPDPPAESSSASSSHQGERDEHFESNPNSRTSKNVHPSFSDSITGLNNPRHQPRPDPGISESKMLAAVDMGTNSFHIVVARADCYGQFQVLDSEKEYVRLGSGATLSLITPDAEARAFEAMKRFKALALAYEAPLRVVATSAVREAGNRGAFLRNMLEKVGVEVEVLSGKEEACLIYSGVLQALPVYDKLVLTVDIGGGSTEFVVGMAGTPIYATSVKLGHLRLTDLFIGSGTELIPKCQLDDIRKHVRGVLKESGVAESVRNAGFELAIGSSGTIETIEQIVNQGYAGDYATLLINEQSHLDLCGLREREFTMDELAVIVRKLCKAKNNEQRAKMFGLTGKRAEVLVGGAVLLEEIFIALDIHKMRVSPYALREGVIVDTLAKTCSKYELSPNVRWSSIVSLARRFYTKQRLASASHSAHLAKDILAGLKTIATTADSNNAFEVASLLDDTDTELLEAAATLHAIGMSIGFRDYHKHSHYLIKNNDILVGYNPMEVKIMSLLAKYHRKKVPSKNDEDFTQLPAEVKTKTMALCAIIRVAVALNRCHCSAVKTVHVIQEGHTCVLVAVPSMNPFTKKLHDVSLELWAAQDKLEFFEKVFKRKASIVIADHNDESSLKVDDLSDQMT